MIFSKDQYIFKTDTMQSTHSVKTPYSPIPTTTYFKQIIVEDDIMGASVIIIEDNLMASGIITEDDIMASSEGIIEDSLMA